MVGSVAYHVLRERPDVEVVRDEVVDVLYLALRNLLADFLAALAAGNGLAPDFRGESIFRVGGLVPFGAALAIASLRISGGRGRSIPLRMAGKM